MSIEARQAVVNSPLTIFQADSQRLDLLNPNLTDSNLIALIQYLIERGHAIEFTAIRSDHHDDGPKGHAGGLAFDCWPLNTPTAGDYVPANALMPFLADVSAFPGLYQLGLAGTAYTQDNVEATGLIEDFSADPCVFHDLGQDHLHLGVHPA